MKNFDRHPATTTKLLEEIDKANYPNTYQWQDWQVERLTGGRNNLLYCAQKQDQKIVIKFTTRDERDRAGREYQNLSRLQEVGLEIAPKPLLLDRTSYRYPVVVQTWMDGEAMRTLPDSDHEWLKLLEHFVLIHKAVAPAEAMKLPRAAISMIDAKSGVKYIEEQFLLIPESKRSTTIKRLLERLQSIQYPTWSEPTVGLCRCDPAPLNFLKRSDAWRSVDWENGGWGDPAFEIADLIAHPSYSTVEQPRWDWCIDTYTNLIADSEAPRRIRVYYAQMVIWWIVRLSRELSAPPERLADRAPGWQLEASKNLERYLTISEIC